MTYNLTGALNATNIIDPMTTVNNATDQLFGALILVGICVVLLWGMLSRGVDAPSAFFGASVVTLVVSLVFIYMGWSSVEFLIGFFVIAAASALALYNRNK